MRIQDFGNYISTRRKELGLSQKDLADFLSVSIPTISKYENGSIFNHEERRTRKLLLNKKEILKLRDKVEISGYTLIPIKLYFKKL